MNFTKTDLKKSLNTAGIPDSLMELALPEFERADTIKILADGKKLIQPDMSKLVRIKVPKGKNRMDLVEHLNSLPEVLYAEPNGRPSPQLEPNDTQYQADNQWGLNNAVFPQSDIHAKEAWDIFTGNPNNIIAIVDGGVQTSHADLDSKIAGGDTGYGWDGHGTHVAGIAAAETNNGSGIAGVDWNAKIHPQRIDNVDYAGTYQAIVDAVDYSSNVTVLNHSWVFDEDNPGANSLTVRQAFAYAYKANRTSVVIMGNHQDTHPDVVAYPAGYSNVIAVGATTNSPWEIIRGTSAHGNHIDVCAPGENIESTINSSYGQRSGTSMAAPFVSGVASLLKGYNSNLANDDIEHIIQLSADDLGNPGFDNTYGHGRLNAERALNYLRDPYVVKQWTATSGTSVGSTQVSQIPIFGVSGLGTGVYSAIRYEVRKTITFPENFLHIEGVWGRGAFSNGWSLENPNFGEGFCEIVPGSLTDTGVTLRTYVYKLYNISGSYVGYYPTTPSNATFAYTVLGIPAPILHVPDVICYNSYGTVSIENPPDVTITWGGTNVTYPNGNTGVSAGVKATSSSISAQGTVTASFTVDGTPFTLSEDVWVGNPNLNVMQFDITSADGGNWYVCTDQTGNSFDLSYFNNKNKCTNYEIKLTNPNETVVYDQFYSSSGIGDLDYPSLPEGWYVFWARGYNGCGWSNWVGTEVEFTDCSQMMLMMTPNPTSGETTLSIESNTDQISSYKDNFDYNQEWDMEIYSPGQTLKTKKTKLKGKSTTIQTAGWTEGIYSVRVKYKEQVLTGKLVVKR